MATLSRPSSSPPSSRAFYFALAALCGFLLFTRFYNLDGAPQGFYVDEAAAAAHVACFAHQKTNAFGQSLPLFSTALGGGYTTPAFLYGAGLWAHAFGGSIVALRAFVALVNILTVIGLGCVAFLFGWSRSAVVGTVVAAALSPWGFVFSRIFWDPPLAPFFLIWGLVFLFGGERWPRKRLLFWSLGAVLMGLAMYSYPPTRAQVPFVLAGFLSLSFSRLDKINRARWACHVLGSGVILIAVLVPLVRLTLSGEIQGRFEMLSIFSDGYVQQFGTPTFFLKAQLLSENFLRHFHPHFLFLAGDGNLRHSTQWGGEWSWFDLLGILAVGCAGIHWLCQRKMSTNRPRNRFASSGLYAFICLGYLAGILPAAMTWEGVPHALRAIGAWPFLALFVGGGIGFWIERSRVTLALATLTAASFGALYFHDYFNAYPSRSRIWFDVGAVEALQAGGVLPGYPSLPAKYFKAQSSGRWDCGP